MSRPRSGRSSGGPAPRGSAPRGGRPGVFVQAPKSDIYVALLGIALGAMTLGTILLVLILARYDFKLRAATSTALPAIASLDSAEKMERATTIRL